jgi:acetyltransferase
MRTLPFENTAGEPTAPPLAQTSCEASDLLADLTGPCALRDGVVVMVRAIRDEDLHRLQAFHLGLSSRTLYLRFGHLLAGFPDELAAWLTCVDGDRRMAFVATDTAHERASAHQTIIAVARYEHVRPQVAELAEVVADRWQGRGLGPQLLYRLAVYARCRGYTTLIGYVRSTNERALHVLLRGALPYTLTRLDVDTVLATIDITRARLAEALGLTNRASGG